MGNSSFRKDKVFSKSFEPVWDKYYRSNLFKTKLKNLRKKGDVEIVRIDRTDNPIFQSESWLDCVIVLSTGSSLKIDEKTLRYPKKECWLNTFPVEVCSNPNKGGKHDGWGYHIGTTLAMSYATFSNDPEDGFETKPLFFTINQNFVDNIVRGNRWDSIPSKKTNNFYRSVCKYIPRNVLERYWLGRRKSDVFGNKKDGCQRSIGDFMDE